jgi:hypothetical protein
MHMRGVPDVKVGRGRVFVDDRGPAYLLIRRQRRTPHDRKVAPSFLAE